MHQPAPPRPKLAETVIETTVKLRETTIGRCCEVLGDSALEYSELGDYSYLGPGCMIGDAQIGRFCAIAALVRIGAPNHPLDRPSQHLHIAPNTTSPPRSGIMPSSNSDGPIAS